MKEIFKDIPGYEGLYQASTYGRVKSLVRIVKHKNHYKHIKEHISVGSIHNRGYKIICLSKLSKRKAFLVHRLIALTFLPNLNNKQVVNHIDGDKINNEVTNLEFVTQKENIRHAIRSGCIKIKPISQYTLSGELVENWECAMDIYKALGINNSNISKCCKGFRNKAGGFVWKYLYKESVRLHSV